MSKELVPADPSTIIYRGQILKLANPEQYIRGIDLPMKIITFDRRDDMGIIIEKGLELDYGHLGL